MCVLRLIIYFSFTTQMPKRKQPEPRTPREVWDKALQSQITHYNIRLARYKDVPLDERLAKLLPGIEARRDRLISRMYENLKPEHQQIVDRMKPNGKIRAWAKSGKNF
jgi:hypothetical protein